MTINGNIYLRGFEKHDHGDEGIVFLRYLRKEKDERKAEIYKSPMYYGGLDADSFIINIPKPQERKFDACVVLTRSSKNKYTVTAFDNEHILLFKSDSLDDVQKRCNEFFKI